MAVQNTGDNESLFDQLVAVDNDLLSQQIDPSEPQVSGLSTTTDPLVVDQHISTRLAAFDPDRYDLSENSILIRLLSSLLGAAGVGGIRKQETINRMGAGLAGTSFLDLDGFWGALFGLRRLVDEQLPTTDDGSSLNPSSDIADSVTWEQVESRDGRYRSRIEQLAAGFALGPTADGIHMAASAVLNCEVDVVESWVLADYATESTAGYAQNTWFSVASQYATWGDLDGQNWGALVLGVNDATLDGQAPLGNRGEILIIPSRPITEEERYRLSFVLDKLAPAGTMVTVSDTNYLSEIPISILGVDTDSTHWDIVSLAAPITGGNDLYPNTTEVESARPANSSYTGERWTTNSRIASVTSYTEGISPTATPFDYQTIVFADGTSHDYLPGDALLNAQQAAQSRATADGVATVYPYAAGRFS